MVKTLTGHTKEDPSRRDHTPGGGKAQDPGGDPPKKRTWTEEEVEELRRTMQQQEPGHREAAQRDLDSSLGEIVSIAARLRPEHPDYFFKEYLTAMRMTHDAMRMLTWSVNALQIPEHGETITFKRSEWEKWDKWDKEQKAMHNRTGGAFFVCSGILRGILETAQAAAAKADSSALVLSRDVLKSFEAINRDRDYYMAGGIAHRAFVELHDEAMEALSGARRRLKNARSRTARARAKARASCPTP